MTTPNLEDNLQLVLSHVINVTRILVFEAFLDPHHIGLWWSPDGFSTTTVSMEPKVGGQWRFIMHGPNGVDFPQVIAYTEIAKPDRLCYDHGRDDSGAMCKTAIDFVEVDQKTTVTVRTQFVSREKLEEMRRFGAAEGWQQTLERLDKYTTPGFLQ
jgi:uncharacterized protein YndB with AHSA1/START domain